MKPSKRTIEALIILRDKKPQSFAQFAKLFWPENLMHRRHTNCGTHGSRRGAGAWFAAGSYIAKLERAGLVRKCCSASGIEKLGIAYLSNVGHEVLDSIKREGEK